MRKKNNCDVCRENCTKHPYHFKSKDGSTSTICARNRGQAIRINGSGYGYDDLYYLSNTCRRSKIL